MGGGWADGGWAQVPQPPTGAPLPPDGPGSRTVERDRPRPSAERSRRIDDRIRRLTDGGAQYTLDTTASVQLIDYALRALRPTGHLDLVARLRTPLPREPGVLGQGGRISHIREGDAVPGLMIPRLTGQWQAGRFPFDELIRTYPLADINDAERDCDAGRVVKPILLPEGRIR